MRIFKELFMNTVGCALLAFAINGLLVPAHLITGGLAGLCILLYHWFGFPLGTLTFILNIPLLIVGYRYVGRKFFYYTIYSVAVLSLFLDIPIHHVVTNDPLLAAIFGGVVLGLGGAIILRFGGSSGGFDILARIVAKYRNVTLGGFNLVMNSAIVIASIYLFGIQSAMFSLISIFTAAKTYEVVLNHVDRISLLVITDRGHQVAEKITQSMRRGVTMWSANGAYTQQDKHVLLCVIVNIQMTEVRKMILEEDPQAFITVIPTQNVIGQFEQVW